MKNYYYLSILVFTLISGILFISIDYLVKINLDNINIITLKNRSSNDLNNLDTEIYRLDLQLENLKLSSIKTTSFSFPTLNDIKVISKKHALLISNVQKTKDIENNKKLYNIAIEGTIYNIINFLKSFESDYYFEVEQITVQPIDLIGEKLNLQLSIILES